MPVPPVIQVDAATRLRPWHPDDGPVLAEAVNGSRTHIAEWLPWADGYTAERADEFIARCLASYREGTMLEMCVEVHGAVGGGCGLVRIDHEQRKAEIGYWLALPHTKQGVMTRAVAALTDYALRDMGFHRVQVAALAGNSASRAIPERLGFRQEGLFHAARLHRGQWHDLAWYAVTEDEWRRPD